MGSVIKKLFKHGGSYAVDIPVEFVRLANGNKVILEMTGKMLSIRPKSEIDTLDSDPLFSTFVRALAHDAMKHPEKLRRPRQVWDKEWDQLLKGVKADDE